MASPEAGQGDGNARSDIEALPERPGVGGPSQWFVRSGKQGDWAGYGPPYSEPTVSVRCDRENNRLVFRTIAMPRSGAGETTIQLSVPGLDQEISAQADEEGLPGTEASVPTDAEWLERLVTASGSLTIRAGSSDAIVVPVGQQLTSLIRDCRR
jgi:hypothetical protein